VEAAIIVPLIVLLTFGAIEYGFAFNEQGTVRSATRSAARAAATQSKIADSTPGVSNLENAAIAALTASVDNLINGDPQFALIYHHTGTDITTVAGCGTDCRVYSWNGTAFVRSGGDEWAPSERGACAGRADNLAVFLQVRHDFLTGLPLAGSSSRDLESTTVMALEPYPGASCEQGSPP